MDFKYDVIVIGAGHAGSKQPLPQRIWVQRLALSRWI